MKKMTQKEFFEILEKSGHYARNFDDVLNALAAHASMSEKEARELGCPAAERMYDRVRCGISEVLEARGYYNDMK